MMPVYKYECRNCKKCLTQYRKIVNRNDKTKCPHCNSVMQRVFEQTAAIHVFEPYVNDYIDVDPILITSRRQEEREFEKRGLTHGRDLNKYKH